METHFGIWWIPAKPELEVMGVLITGDDDFWLELESDFGSILQSEDGTSVYGLYPEIHGVVQGVDFSLLDAYQTASGITLRGDGRGSSTSSSKWHGSWLVKGTHAKRGLSSNRILVEFDGLQGWTRFSAVAQHLSQGGDDRVAIDGIGVGTPANISVTIGSQTFWLKEVVRSERLGSGFSVYSTSTLTIESTTSITIDKWWDEFIEPFIRFVQLCTGKGGQLDVLAIPSNETTKDGGYFCNHHLVPNRSRRVSKEGTHDSIIKDANIATMGDVFSEFHMREWLLLYRDNNLRHALDAFIDMRIRARPLTNPERCFICVRCIEVLLTSEYGNVRFTPDAYQEIQLSIRQILGRDGLDPNEVNDIIVGVKRLRENKLKIKLRQAIVDASALLSLEDTGVDAIVRAAAEVRDDFAHTGAGTDLPKLVVATHAMECVVLMTLLQRIGMDKDQAVQNIQGTTVYRNARTVIELYSAEL